MNLVIVGYGDMGKTLLEQISLNSDIDLVGVVDRINNLGVSTFDELKVVPDVIVDFSHPTYLNEMLEYSKENSVALVIATTGYILEQEDLIKEASNSIAILRTSNTSFGVNLLLEVLKQITPLLEEDYDIEVIEKHHNKKIDAPSGTAKMIVDEIVNSKSSESNLVYGRNGVSKRETRDITIHAVRGGTIAGEHTVIYAGDDEIIEIKHQALSKKVFANGALKAAKYIKGKNSGLYSMKDVLFK